MLASIVCWPLPFFQVGEQRTCSNWLCIRHIHGELQSAVSTKASARNQAWRTGYNVALAGQLAAPPMGIKELNEFGGAVYIHEICARASLEHFVKDTCDWR